MSRRNSEFSLETIDWMARNTNESMSNTTEIRPSQASIEVASMDTRSEQPSPAPTVESGAVRDIRQPAGHRQSDQNTHVSSDTVHQTLRKHRFISYKLKGEYEQPWSDHSRMKRTRINNYIVWVFTIVGFIISALICFMDVQSIKSHDYCLIYDDDFATLDKNVWNHEVQLDGFGTQSFDWTTTDPKNAFVDVEGLHIVPTLTNETTDITNDKLYNGHTLNLTADGTCTSDDSISCVISSNSTKGKMIPPIRSARLNTKGKKSIRYGKVEVVAKLPDGDWLWPAIWMMPEDSVYGNWPKSGEIDIMESRGNAPGYSAGGRDVFSSTLHWGMDTATDAFWRTTAGKEIRRTDYSKSFHTYGIEWTEDHIFTYLDSKLVQVLFVGFKADSSLWKLGKFQGQSENQTLLTDPWVNSTSPHNAPFDQKFFLILNVAVGSRNGWFPDNKDDKPWLDAGASSQWDFYRNAHSWLPTWGKGNDRGMTVKRVKMWQQGKC